MDEENWTDIDFLTSANPPTWGYPVSKTLAEKAAWKFADRRKQRTSISSPSFLLDLMAGPSLTPDIPSSMGRLAMSLITGNEFLINGLKGTYAMQTLSGSISISHVEDVCRAHIFVAARKNQLLVDTYVVLSIQQVLPSLQSS